MVVVQVQEENDTRRTDTKTLEDEDECEGCRGRATRRSPQISLYSGTQCDTSPGRSPKRLIFGFEKDNDWSGMYWTEEQWGL